jgi:hypothetical protein
LPRPKRVIELHLPAELYGSRALITALQARELPTMESILRALGMAFAMGWEILWPLILGFALHAARPSFKTTIPPPGPPSRARPN